MKHIILSAFKKNNEVQIKIEFSYDYKTKEYIKKFPNVKWNTTHKGFYLPFSKAIANQLYLYLKEGNYSIDYHQLTDYQKNNKKLSPLNENFKKDLNSFKSWMLQKRYSHNTITTYLSMTELFFRFHSNKTIARITKKDIEEFNTEYILKNNYSATFQNQLISAIKLFYTYTNNSHLELDKLDRPKKSNRLPEVLSIDEVKSILRCTKNLKHKTLLSLLYSCGLRIGEALNLKINYIDQSRKLLFIKCGKGRKDRYIPLSNTMITLLIKYFHAYKPKTYLFEGQNSPKYSAVSARQVLRRSILNTKINKHVTLHTLRHSYATHLLENGTDIRFIQELLGHNSMKTTMIYTHVSTTSLGKIKNPFDDFNI